MTQTQFISPIENESAISTSTTPRTETPVCSATFADFAHLIWMAVGAGGAVAFLMCVIESSPGQEIVFFGQIVLALTLATMFVTAAWAVWGPGSYLKRLFWSHAVGFVVALGLVVGSLALRNSLFGMAGDTEFLKTLGFALLAVPPISLAAQIPFWFFRFFFGWQITFCGSKPVQSFTLRDIFVFTFVCALGLATPQMASSLVMGPQFDPEISYEEVNYPDGTTGYEEVRLVDPEAIEKNRREYTQQQRRSVLFGFGIGCFWIFAISLLSIPAALIMFRSKETQAGCGFVAVYAGGWIVFFVVLLSSFGGGVGIQEVFGYLAFFLLTYGAVLSVPFAVSREKGFQLTSPRRYRMKKENEARSRFNPEQPQTSSEKESELESEMPESVPAIEEGSGDE